MFLSLLIRNLHLGPLLSSKFHTSISCAATFSVTREIWGKTDAEIEEEKGIPEPPRQVTLGVLLKQSFLLEKTIT